MPSLTLDGPGTYVELLFMFFLEKYRFRGTFACNQDYLSAVNRPDLKIDIFGEFCTYMLVEDVFEMKTAFVVILRLISLYARDFTLVVYPYQERSPI